MISLTKEFVEEIHNGIILLNELQGLAKNKDLEACLERVHNRVQYGLIEDIFQLASCYAMVIAQAHCFHDANKRTAFAVATLLLQKQNIHLIASPEEIGQQIIALATQQIDEHAFANFLKKHAKNI